MANFSFSIILIPLLQSIQGSISFLLLINLLLHAILIISFLGVTWNRNNSPSGALKAGKVVLGLYIVFLVIDALIYIVNGGMPYISGGYLMLASFFNPVLFFIFLSPPIPLMYLDIQSSESSQLYTSLSKSGLALLIWLIVIAVALGFSYMFVVIY